MSKLCRFLTMLLVLAVSTMSATIADAQSATGLGENAGSETTASLPFYFLDSKGAQIQLESANIKMQSNKIQVEGGRSPVRVPSGTEIKLLVHAPRGTRIQFMRFNVEPAARSIPVQKLDDGKYHFVGGTDASPVRFDVANSGSDSFIVKPKRSLDAGEYCIGVADSEGPVSCFGVGGSTTAEAQYSTPGNSASTSLPTDQTENASTLDVGGVRLGMTPDEAIEALKKYDSWPILKKRYILNADRMINRAGVYTGWGELGSSDDCPIMKNRPNRVLVAIVAAKANRQHPNSYYGPAGITETHLSAAQLAAESECDWSGTAMGSKPGEDPSEVAVYFSPVPGAERVIAVSRWTRFGEKPTVQAVLDGALRKYPPEFTAKPTIMAPRIVWRFDERNRVMSEQEASRFAASGTSFLVGNGQGFSLPGEITSSGGIGLDFVVAQAAGSPELAAGYSVSLYRESDLFRFGSEAHAYFASIQEKRKADEIEKAKQNPVQIK